jgi:hypothetical protein
VRKRRKRQLVVQVGCLGVSAALAIAACGSADDSLVPFLPGAADAATPFLTAFGTTPGEATRDSGVDAPFVGPPFTNEAGVIFEDAGLLTDSGSGPFVSDSGSNPFVSDSGSNPFVSDSGASPNLGLPFGQ